MLKDRITTAGHCYEEELCRLSPGIFSGTPIKVSVDYNSKTTGFDHYFVPHIKLIDQLDAIEQVYGSKILYLYLIVEKSYLNFL